MEILGWMQDMPRAELLPSSSQNGIWDFVEQQKLVTMHHGSQAVNDTLLLVGLTLLVLFRGGVPYVDQAH